MQRKSIAKIAAAAVTLTLGLGVVAQAAATLFTVVGGASGMTLDLNPYGSLVRGCAPKMMDVCLKNKRNDPDTGAVKHVYCRTRIKSNDAYSEPNADGPWGTNQVKFSGDNKDSEIEYCQMEDGSYQYGIVIRADSVGGMRYVVNRQYIYDFLKCSSSTDGWTFTLVNDDGTKSNAMLDAGFQQVYADMATKINFTQTPATSRTAGINVEGGLTEAYLDSGIRAIDKWNAMFPAIAPGPAQPQLNPANLRNTPDTLLSVAVMGVIYNRYIQDNWNSGQQVNFTTEMVRMIEGGMVDTWDYFFSSVSEPNPDHKKIYSFFREPLSGTGITYLGLVQRGVDTSPNGATATDMYDWTDGTFKPVPNPGLVKSGIPGLTCISTYSFTDGTKNVSPFNPGGGEVNKCVNNYYGGIGYTFLQKFTKDNGSYDTNALSRIRIAEVNGYFPYYQDPSVADADRNSLPGVNGCPDVTAVVPGGKSFYQAVVDGRYPLWTYNHCFARPDARGTTSSPTPLDQFIEKFTNTNYEQNVRDVGLIALNDMETYARYRSIPASGVNAGRGKGLGRCGFTSPLTGEFVRDGMMMMPKDQNSADPTKLPSEGYPEMRP